MGHVLFLMPSWSAPSELWMRRMLEALAGRLGAIACYEPPVASDRGVPVIDLGRRADEASVRRGLSAVREFLAADPRRVVLAHYLPFAMRCRAAWSGLPNRVFVHAHGYDLTEDLHRPGPDGVPVRFHPPDYARQVVDLAGHLNGGRLIANSYRSREKLLAMGVPGAAVVVKYLGVPVPEVPPVRSVEPGRLRVLFLGRLVDFKGPRETVEAFVLARSRGLAGTLTVAGDGDRGLLPDPLPEGVSWVGAVSAEQGEALRRTHDVFVAHSRVGPVSRQEEALGVAYLEAMASGMPVVSASGGSLAEVVEDGVSGLLVEPGDVAGQADALLRLVGDVGLYRRLSMGAWRAAGARFSDEAEAAALRSLLG